VSEQIPAVWHDGKTSRGRPVLLHVWVDQLHIDAEDGESLAVSLASAQLQPRLGRTERIIRLADGGRLRLADAPELERWFPNGSRVEALAHRLERRWSMVALAALLFVALLFGLHRWAVPAMAESVAERLPRMAEQAAASQVMSLLDRAAFGPSKLPAARQQQLRAAFAELVADLPRVADYRLEFRDGGDLGANALALPDGRIVMTDALVERAGSDDWLIAVLAHEAGHHEQRHGMRLALQNTALLVVIGFVTGDVSSVASVATAAMTLVESGYSRQFEREADAFAFDLLQRNGISPQAFADALRAMQAGLPDDSSSAFRYFSTHPAIQERIETAERAARSGDTRSEGMRSGAARSGAGDSTPQGD
jgi:Zn-dependent protease with chaperone function